MVCTDIAPTLLVLHKLHYHIAHSHPELSFFLEMCEIVKPQ